MSDKPKVISWLPETHSDLERLDSFLRALNPQAADQAIDAVMETASSLLLNPERGYLIDRERNIRQLTVPSGKHGYILWYRVSAEAIEIIRVWHGKEDRNI